MKKKQHKTYKKKQHKTYKKKQYKKKQYIHHSEKILINQPQSSGNIIKGLRDIVNK